MNKKVLWTLFMVTFVLIPSVFAFEPLTTTTALALLTAGAGTAGVGAGLGGMFGLFGKKKQDRTVPDPLAGLRAQLQALASEVPGQVARQKELTAQNIAEAKRTGTQGIAESTRAERGFGASSIETRLQNELAEKLIRAQSEADLKADIWGTGEQARILSGTAGMYPTQTELPEEDAWQQNLLGLATNMAVQNWMNENQWKNMAKYFGGSSGGGKPIVSGYLEELPYITSKLRGGGSQYLNFP